MLGRQANRRVRWRMVFRGIAALMAAVMMIISMPFLRVQNTLAEEDALKDFDRETTEVQDTSLDTHEQSPEVSIEQEIVISELEETLPEELLEFDLTSIYEEDEINLAEEPAEPQAETTPYLSDAEIEDMESLEEITIAPAEDGIYARPVKDERIQYGVLYVWVREGKISDLRVVADANANVGQIEWDQIVIDALRCFKGAAAEPRSLKNMDFNFSESDGIQYYIWLLLDTAADAVSREKLTPNQEADLKELLREMDERLVSQAESQNE